MVLRRAMEEWIPTTGLGFRVWGLGSSLYQGPFAVPNIVRHPYNKDPKGDPNLENHPYSFEHSGYRRVLGFKVKV